MRRHEKCRGRQLAPLAMKLDGNESHRNRFHFNKFHGSSIRRLWRTGAPAGAPYISILIVLCLLSSGCRNPFDRTRDASNAGPAGTFGTTSAFVIYSNELQSGGGAFLYPGSEGQSLAFNDTSNPISRRSIRYSWTGAPVTNLGYPAQNPTHNFAGFNLMDTPTQAGYDAQTVGRNLSQAHYQNVTFYARGALTTNTLVKIEVASPGSSNACVAGPSACLILLGQGTTYTPPDVAQPDIDACLVVGGHQKTLMSGWQSFTVPIADATLLSNVKDFFKVTFVFKDIDTISTAPGQGGVVYIDQIQYEK